jgi:hypothetical protein
VQLMAMQVVMQERTGQDIMWVIRERIRRLLVVVSFVGVRGIKSFLILAFCVMDQTDTYITGGIPAETFLSARIPQREALHWA